MFMNPYPTGIKKVFFELLKENYTRYENSIDDVSELASNEKRYKTLAELFLAVYEAGYVRSVKEHKQVLEKLGVKATIKEKSPAENQKE